MNKRIKIIALLVGVLSGSVLFGADVGRRDEIKLVSGDGREFSAPRDIAEMSGTIKDLLADIGLTTPIPVNVTADRLKAIIDILREIKGAVLPRSVDGQYSPYKVQPIVDRMLRGKTSVEIKNILLAANYLDIPFLINAAARLLVSRDDAYVRNIVVKYRFDIIPDELHDYLLKHLALAGTLASREYSVADFIEEHDITKFIKPAGEEYFEEATLDLSSKWLTSLEGLSVIAPDIRSRFSGLDLRGNVLVSIPPGTFSGFEALKFLDLSINLLRDIQPKAFEGLDNLESLVLTKSELTYITKGTFFGLKNLTNLFLDSNRISDISPEEAFMGLDAVREINVMGNPLTDKQMDAIRRYFEDKGKTVTLDRRQVFYIRPAEEHEDIEE